MCFLFESILFGGRPQAWMKFCRRGTVCVEGTGDAEAILWLFLNLGGVHRSQGELLYTNLAEHSYWLCDFASIESFYRFLLD